MVVGRYSDGGGMVVVYTLVNAIMFSFLIAFILFQFALFFFKKKFFPKFGKVLLLNLAFNMFVLVCNQDRNYFNINLPPGRNKKLTKLYFFHKSGLKGCTLALNLEP